MGEYIYYIQCIGGNGNETPREVAEKIDKQIKGYKFIDILHVDKSKTSVSYRVKVDKKLVT
jgi:hypothetical protein